MSKQKSPAGITWGKASKELKDKVKFVLQQAQNNRYSVSRIYAAHNAIFELEEAPQTCSTCLTSRVKKLREWWHANDPKTDAVKTTGEAQEATSFEGVVAKYKLPIGEGLGETTDEGSILQPIVEGGQEASGMGVNEYVLLEARYGELVGAAADTELVNLVNGKLGALGLTSKSSDAETLEGYKVLASEGGISEAEQNFYNAQIEIITRNLAEGDSGFVFTPAGEGALYGTATHNGEILADGDYIQDGKTYCVSEGAGGYIEVVEPTKAAAHSVNAPAGDPPPFRVIDMGEGVLGMHFTPSAEAANKGTVVNADGSKVKPGTYTAADGGVIAVAVGGKATIK